MPLSILTDSTTKAESSCGGVGDIAKVADMAIHPGEDSVLDRLWGGHKFNYSQKTTSGSVKGTAGVYGGWVVVATTATAAIYIRDGTSASGTIVRCNTYWSTIRHSSNYASSKLP